jgi:hypothetical protein
VLLLAGDEVPSAALAAALPGLCAEPSLRQVWLPTRWVWPDRAHWLDALPWYPDVHNRLLRNDDDLWFEGRLHSYARPRLPMRYVESPLYHLVCLMEDAHAREERARRYEERRPGLRAHGGGSLNERMYLPERFARRPPAPIPEEDLAAIAAVLDAGDDPPAAAPPRGPIPVGRRAEIDALWAGRELEPGAYRAKIAPMERDHRIVAGEERPVLVRVRNEGTVAWPSGSDRPPDVRLSYHWRDAGGATVVHDGVRTHFPEAVAPGAETILPAVVAAPARAGEYLLVLDLVHEHVRWFGCETALPMTVEPDPDELAPRPRLVPGRRRR